MYMYIMHVFFYVSWLYLAIHIRTCKQKYSTINKFNSMMRQESSTLNHLLEKYPFLLFVVIKIGFFFFYPPQIYKI